MFYSCSCRITGVVYFWFCVFLRGGIKTQLRQVVFLLGQHEVATLHPYYRGSYQCPLYVCSNFYGVISDHAIIHSHNAVYLEQWCKCSKQLT